MNNSEGPTESFSHARRAWVWLKTYGRAIPLLGPLFTCTLKNHFDSLKEFLISIAFGTATFTVTAMLLRGHKANATADYWDLLYRTMDSGQLFIFAVSMLGPILISSAEDPAQNKSFPSRSFHFTFLLFIAAIAAGYYSQFLLAREVANKGLFDTEYLFNVSVVVSVAVVALRYLTIVYRKSTVDVVVERDFPVQAQDLTRGLIERHGGKSE